MIPNGKRLWTTTIVCSGVPMIMIASASGAAEPSKFFEILKCGSLGLAAIVAFCSFEYLINREKVCTENRKALTVVLVVCLLLVIVMTAADVIHAKSRENLAEMAVAREELSFSNNIRERHARALREISIKINTACGSFDSNGNLPANCPLLAPDKLCELLHAIERSITNELAPKSVSFARHLAADNTR